MTIEEIESILDNLLYKNRLIDRVCGSASLSMIKKYKDFDDKKAELLQAIKKYKEQK